LEGLFKGLERENLSSLSTIGLSLIFAGYAFVESSEFAVFLYIADHLFFSIAIALKTYFQKIADPADIASSSGVSFTINHIAAVFIPVAFGLVWLYSPSLVFLAGSGNGNCLSHFGS
jgi:hypothetical protein